MSEKLELIIPIEVDDKTKKEIEKAITDIILNIIISFDKKPYMNKKQAAEFIGVSFNTLAKFIKAGLPVINVEGMELISIKDIHEFMESNRTNIIN